MLPAAHIHSNIAFNGTEILQDVSPLAELHMLLETPLVGFPSELFAPTALLHMSKEKTKGLTSDGSCGLSRASR